MFADLLFTIPCIMILGFNGGVLIHPSIISCLENSLCFIYHSRIWLLKVCCLKLRYRMNSLQGKLLLMMQNLVYDPNSLNAKLKKRCTILHLPSLLFLQCFVLTGFANILVPPDPIKNWCSCHNKVVIRTSFPCHAALC